MNTQFQKIKQTKKKTEQSGGAERINQTLMDTVRAMFSDSKLFKKFWAEALSTVAYVRNRSRTAVERMTPYEAWKSQAKCKPFSNFWIWCLCSYS